MSHTLILGMTESGKTTLARRMSHSLKAEGYGVLVLDPLCDPRWACDFVSPDPDAFLAVFWKSRSCHVFIDEASESVGRYDAAMLRTATRGRHWGHSCYYLSQRATLVAQTVRDQCRHLYLFTLSTEDAKILAQEWNRPELKAASSIAQGNYFHVSRFGDLERGSLFGNAWSEGNEPDITRPDDRRDSGSGGRGVGVGVHPKKGNGVAGVQVEPVPGAQGGDPAAGAQGGNTPGSSAQS